MLYSKQGAYTIAANFWSPACSSFLPSADGGVLQRQRDGASLPSSVLDFACAGGGSRSWFVLAVFAVSRSFKWIAVAGHRRDDCTRGGRSRNAETRLSAIPGKERYAAQISKLTRVSSVDWLTEGAVLRTGEKSKALIILLNGHRFELGANARATIGPTQLWNTSGPVREMAPLPPTRRSKWPRIPPPPAVSGARRILKRCVRAKG